MNKIQKKGYFKEFQKENFRRRLIELRNSKKLTQDEISKKLGISKSAYENYENKKNSIPPIDILVKISNLFNKNLEWLLDIEWEGEKVNNPFEKNSKFIPLIVLGMLGPFYESLIKDLFDDPDISEGLNIKREVFKRHSILQTIFKNFKSSDRNLIYSELLKYLITLIKSDRVITMEEENFINKLLMREYSDFQINSNQRKQIKNLIKEKKPTNYLHNKGNKELRILVYPHISKLILWVLCIVSHSDGNFHLTEWEYIKTVANHLEASEGDLIIIREKIDKIIEKDLKN